MNKVMFLFAFVFLLLLTGCQEVPSIDVVIESIEINQENMLEEYTIEDLDLSTLSIIVNFSDGTSETIPLTEDYIIESDLSKLSISGTHSITIEYQSFTYTFEITLKNKDVNVLLQQLYDTGLSEGIITGTYEEWLDTIKGENGVGIDQITINNLGELIVILSDGTTKNLGSIIGEDGENGLDGISIDSVHINELGELIVTFSDDRTSNLGAIEGINGEDGADGNDGNGITNVSINLNGDLIIQYSNGSATNVGKIVGKDGITPSIGENGNWWIGDLDTGISVNSAQQTDAATDGLYFVMTSFGGTVGYEVSNYLGTSQDVVIPNFINGMPVISIGANAFTTMNTIKSIEIPQSVMRINTRAFYSNQLLENVYFAADSKLTHIYNEAFYNNTKLKDVDFPDALTYIGPSAFYNTASQYNIYISGNVTFIGANAFYNSSSNSAAIYVESLVKPETWASNWTNKNILQVHFGIKITDGYIYNLTESNTVRIVGYIGSGTQLVIPDKIENKNVTHIGSYGFAFNLNLKGIKLGSNVTTIEAYAFYYTTRLRYLVIPDSVTTIQNYAFDIAYEHATEIVFTQIYYERSKPGVCEWWCFENWEYEGDAVHWNINIDNFHVQDNLQYLLVNDKVTITGYIDETHSALVIPSKINNKDVIKINKYAFIGSSFTSFDLPNGLLEIGAASFVYQLAAEGFEIPDSVMIIGEYAFANNDFIDYIYIPNSVIIIGALAFFDAGNIMILAEIASKPTGWDSTWNSSNITVHWNVSSYVESADFVAVISGLTAKIVKYTGTGNLIKVPKYIGIYQVTTISSRAITVSATSQMSIVIPDTVQYIEYHGVYNLYSYSYNLRVFSEASAKPSSWDSTWYRYATVYWSTSWTYNQDGVPQLN